MNDDASAQETATQVGQNHASYVRLANDIAEEVSRGRAGFGALRHFSTICRDTVKLALKSGFFANKERQPFPLWLMDEEILYFHLKRAHPDHRYFIDQILASPSSFDPSCLWALFWALAKAEHEFLFRYVPFWSNEERLTGHLISQMVERLTDFAPRWATLNGSPEAQAENQCRIYYADTATARKESLTGADFGLVIQARLGRQPEYFKVARFQAKKAEKSGSARIDFDQVAALLNRPSVGYYIFYHYYDRKEWSLPPTVLPASHFKHRLETLRQEKAPVKTQSLGSESTNAQETGYDFATFLTFALADPASEHGAYVLTAEEAVTEMMVTRPPLSPPSRVMVITLGENASVIDWNELLREYLGQGQ
jgi:hypothetical protein